MAPSLRVVVSMDGSPPDADGVRVALDGGAPRTVPAGGEALFEDLAPGQHEVEVTGLSAECSTERGTRRTVSVTRGATSTHDVAVLCGDAQTIAFWTTRDRDGDIWCCSELYSVRPDGTSLRRLTSTRDAWEYDPSWSPDRTRIAYARQLQGVNRTDLHVRELDGTSDVALLVPGDGLKVRWPAWSPDGSRIAFTLGTFQEGDVPGIWSIPVDGGEPEELTDGGGGSDPAWSPDGSRIVFEREVEGSTDLWLVGADGTGLRPLTDTPAADERSPTWSPDGTRVAFQRLGGTEPGIVALSPDGSVEEVVVDDALMPSIQPSWSPSGAALAAILFPAANPGGALGVVTDGGGTVTPVLLDGSALTRGPAW